MVDLHQGEKQFTRNNERGHRTRTNHQQATTGGEFLKISSVDHGGQSRITAGLMKYACFLTLDPNKANKRLFLSEEYRKVTRVEEKQPYPDHPDRFEDCQVLCRESVCGRCYWEIEWSGKYVFITVSYKSITRKGGNKECVWI
ncbi:neoverrucotoxin subunit alpha-like [Onychostoma macrolepis]|uniref:neoverrucotoxin subunit alpha-like n=1 Tax=Onychostoma macrolepis TaxID=369639 RepID=UPI00272DA399|nr:neoverrucotoxin subunit alpha-like [Onychostoma macrolepis]